MSDLLDTLPKGCTLLRDFIDLDTQGELVWLCRDHLRTFPLVTPTVKGGYPMSVRLSSWGDVGWHSDNGQYRYLAAHPDIGAGWPPIPDLIVTTVQRALIEAGQASYYPDTVLMNWYERGTGKLGMHVDDSEQDRKSPIVTISLGDSCRFDIEVPQEGQWRRRNVKVEKPRGVNLLSGDVLVMAGPSRMLRHGVSGIFESPRNKFMKNGGRISLTARRVFL